MIGYKTMTEMKINNHIISNESSCYIIAEISANHGNNIQVVKDSILSAKNIGANAAKIQTYTADTITLNSNNKDFQIKQGTIWDGRTLYDLYTEAQLPWEWHEELFAYAKEINFTLFSSPFDTTAVDLLEKLDTPAYKIASFEITDYNLIRYVASKKKPIIISTGIATEEEIKDVIEICKSENNHQIAILQCTSAYPAPLERANLKNILDFKNSFNVLAGFSDHTLGSTAAIASISLGAKIIEKHFILDKNIPSPDSSFSLDPQEFKNLIIDIRNTEKLLGKVDYLLTPEREKSRHFSRSLFTSKKIKQGEIFTIENIKSVRPGTGLHPKYLNKILGKKSLVDLDFAQALKLEFVEPF